MSTITKSIDNGILTITVEGFAPIVVNPADYTSNIRDYGFLHGMSQKLGDAGALSVVDGQRPTAAMKHAEIKRLNDYMLESGEWFRTGKGDGAGTDGLLVRALAQLCEKTIEEARADVAGMDKKLQAAMRRDPELAPIIAELKAARAPRTDDDTAAKARGLLAALKRG